MYVYIVCVSFLCFVWLVCMCAQLPEFRQQNCRKYRNLSKKQGVKD